MPETYDVRIWSIREHESKRANGSAKKPKKTYSLRWIVAGKTFSESFPNRALAESFRAELVTAARKGEAFDTLTGRPVSQRQESESGSTWYQHALDYVTMKWPSAAAKSRAGIAETLTAVTLALLRTDMASRPEPKALRDALYGWAFNPSRPEADRPGSVRDALAWIEHASLPLSDLLAAATTRGALDALALRLDGKTAAAKTIGRKRAVFHNALNYAVELERLPANPIGRVQWRTPKTAQAVDKRAVVNPSQARALLRAVRRSGAAGERLEVMFALMYFAALRPAEALSLREVDCDLPVTGWGEALLARSAPRVGSAWTDSGRSREERGLKHRAAGDVRRVPLCPELVALIRRHLDRFGTAPDGRIVSTAQGAVASDSWYGRVWALARTMALSEAQAASPLAQRPYDLRHAAVSTWLNAGVPATQVAEWAGHTVEVLLKVYAKCLDGQESRARRLIELALAEVDDNEVSEGPKPSTT